MSKKPEEKREKLSQEEMDRLVKLFQILIEIDKREGITKNLKNNRKSV